MKISALWITKNEEDNILRSMKSLENIADEFIVVDTGSTDRTVEIAKEFGAKVYYFEWINDFAAAKNYAIEQVDEDCEFIFFLDADEWFEPTIPPDNRKALELFIQNNPDLECLAFPMDNIDFKTGKVNPIDRAARAFMHRPGIRFVRKIHEHLYDVADNRALNITGTDDWKIMHCGYTDENMPAKRRRNLDLLEEIQRSGETNSADNYYLMRENCYEENYDEALLHLKTIINSENDIKTIATDYRTTSIAETFFSLAFFLAQKYRKEFSRRQIHDKLVDGVNEFMKGYPAASFYHLVYQAYFDTKPDVFLKGLEEYESVFKSDIERLKLSDISSISSIFGTAAVMCLKRGDVERALRYAIFFFKQRRDGSKKVLNALISCMRGMEDADVLRVLNSLFDLSNPNTLNDIRNSLVREGFTTPCLYLIKRQIDNGSLVLAHYVYMLILAGDYPGAMRAVMEASQSEPGAAGRSLFFIAACSRDELALAGNRALLGEDYARILESYLAGEPLKEVTPKDKEIVADYYRHISFASGIQAGDMLLNAVSRDVNFCENIKIAYLRENDMYEAILSDTTRFVNKKDPQHASTFIECCYHTGRYEEAVERALEYFKSHPPTDDILQTLLFVSEKAESEQTASRARELYDKYTRLTDEFVDLKDVVRTRYLVDDIRNNDKNRLKNLTPTMFKQRLQAMQMEETWDMLNVMRLGAAEVYMEEGMPAMAHKIYWNALESGGGREVYEGLSKAFMALGNTELAEFITDNYL